MKTLMEYVEPFRRFLSGDFSIPTVFATSRKTNSSGGVQLVSLFRANSPFCKPRATCVAHLTSDKSDSTLCTALPNHVNLCSEHAWKYLWQLSWKDARCISQLSPLMPALHAQCYLRYHSFLTQSDHQIQGHPKFAWRCPLGWLLCVVEKADALQECSFSQSILE